MSLVGASVSSWSWFLTSSALKSVICCCASLPCGHGAVVVAAVALPGGDLRGGRSHIETHLHHADHRVVVVVHVREGFELRWCSGHRMGGPAPNAAEGAAPRRQSSSGWRRASSPARPRRPASRRASAPPVGSDGLHFLVTLVALLHAVNGEQRQLVSGCAARPSAAGLWPTRGSFTTVSLRVYTWPSTVSFSV